MLLVQIDFSAFSYDKEILIGRIIKELVHLPRSLFVSPVWLLTCFKQTERCTKLKGPWPWSNSLVQFM